MDWVVELAEKELVELEEEKVAIDNWMRQYWQEIYRLENRMEMIKCIQGIREAKKGKAKVLTTEIAKWNTK